nr:MAG TPA: hypothetical protein [Caudoviricetes sp.]
MFLPFFVRSNTLLLICSMAHECLFFKLLYVKK